MPRKLGRPRVDSEDVHVRLTRPALNSIDAYIAAQPEPRPTRPEAIRRLLAEALAKTDAAPPPADNANLDGVRCAIMAWVSEWRRDNPDIDDAAIAIYEQAANDLVTNPKLDLSFGYWIQRELDKLVRQKRKGRRKGEAKTSPR